MRLREPGTDLSHPTQIVTASALVRNFGAWQDRAMTSPVYILKRGRARLVMMAADLIEQLGASARPADEWAEERQPLLDAMREVVILLDADRVVRFANNAAVGCFSAEGLGEPIERMLPPDIDGFLVDIIGRVQRSGLREHVEVTLGDAGTRHLSIAIVPLAGGVGLIGHDVSVLHELATANAALSAVDSALAVLDDVAKVRINLRGYLVRPTRSFARMTGLSMEALSSIRFISTIDIGSRAATADAIEQVIANRKPMRVEASLMVNGAPSRPVSIGISPLLAGPSIEGVQAMLVTH